MKKLPLIVLLSVAFTTATSQSFMHGIGFTALGGRLGNRNTSINEGLTYSPRFNFLEKTNLSLSVGIPFTVGITGNYNSSYNTYSGSSTTNTLGLLLNVPLVINFNFGSGASKQTKKRVGYFAGAGGGYYYGSFKENLYNLNGETFENTIKASSFGLAANAGFRFAVGRRTHNIEVRFSYMKSLADMDVKVYGLGAAFNF